MARTDHHSRAALASLITLQGVMLASLYAGVAPHPPAETPLFAIGPFIGAALAVSISAMIVGPAQGWTGRSLAGLAAVMALVSFGPQKYLDPQFRLIWPAVLAGQCASFTLLLGLVLQARGPAKGASDER